jgi:uncharacterized protein YidB (DUF937 family)
VIAGQVPGWGNGHEESVMSVFRDLLGNALNGIAQQVETQVLPNVLSQVLGKTDMGSVGGLLEQLQKSGLGPQVASWLGDGKNLPITADQLRNALGDQNVRQLAASLGIPIDQVLAQLSQHLPTAIDHMSPHGTLEEQAGPA